MKILCVSSRFPYPLIKGDKLKVYQLIKHLSKRHSIYLVTFVESKDELKYLSSVAQFTKRIVPIQLSRTKSYLQCVKGLFSPLPFQTFYYNSKKMHREISNIIVKEKFDLVYVHLIRMAEYLRHKKGLRKILAIEDSISSNYKHTIKFRKGLRKLLFSIEAKRCLKYEIEITRHFDKCLLVSPSELQIFREKHHLSNLELTPHGVDVDYFRPDHREPCVREPNSIIFTGNINYLPNADAVSYFCNSIFPLVLKEVPDSKFYIVGANAPRKIQELACKNIVVTGYVEDMRLYFEKAELVVCPLRIGAGIQNKILEGLAMGLPVVATSCAIEGITSEVTDCISLGDTPDEFAKNVVLLLKNRELREKYGNLGREFVESYYDWGVNLTRLDSVFSG